MKLGEVIKQELFKYRLELFAIVFFQIAATIFATVMPNISGGFLDGMQARNFSAARNMIIALVIVAVMYETVNFLGGVISGAYKERVSSNLTERIILHLQKIPLLELLKKDPIALSQQLSMDTSMAIALVTDFFMEIAYCILVILISVLNLFLTNKLTLIPIILFMLAYVITFFAFQNKISDTMMDFRESQKEYFSRQTEQLEKVKTIKSNGAEMYFFRRTQEAIQQLYDTCKRTYRASGGYSMVNKILSKLSMAGLWTVAIVLVMNNKISLGAFVTISAFYEMIIAKTSDLTEAIVFVRQTQSSLSRISELLQIEEEACGDTILENVSTIKTENLSFGYTENNIFTNLNLSFEKGKTYLLRGTNGKGKSSLLNVLSGLYSQYNGRIFYNGADLQELNRSNLIGCVEQEPLMVSGTIRDNILLGIIRPVRDEELTDWLRRMYLDKFVTRLDDNIEGLSGGEKQKLAIIRLLIRNPVVMLFDEATSALDDSSANALKTEILKIKKKKIIIMIEHSNRMDGIADVTISL